MRADTRRARWIIGVAVAVAAMTSCSSSPDAAPAAKETPATDQLAAAERPTGPTDLRQLLFAPGPGHPAVGTVTDLSFKEALTKGLLIAPGGMTYAPDSCVNFLDMGGGNPATLNGRMQFNDKAPVGKSHNLADDDLFVNILVELPANVDVAKIRSLATACDAGAITLAAKGRKLTGKLTNTEAKGPDLPGASVFAMSQVLEFAPAKNRAEADVLESFYNRRDADGGILRDKHLVVVAIGKVLYMVNVEHEKFANEMATAFYEKAVKAGLVTTQK